MSRFLTRSATALAAAVLGGCSMIPAYQRPPAPVAANFPGNATAPARDAAAAAIAWETFFSDAPLRTLITQALANNRDLRVAALNIEQTRAQYQIRRADEFPTLNAAATGSRVPTASGGIASTYQVGLSVTAWEIDVFGRIASLREAALAQYLASEEGRKAVQISLVSSVAATWLALQADEELLAITRQTLDTREESLRLTQLRFDNGATSELDLRQAASLVEGARVTLAQLQRQRALDENLLTLLVGQPLGSLAIAPLSATAPLADVPAGLPSELLANRPDIRQAEQQLLASNANIGAARAAFFPRIALTVGAGTASNHLSGLFASGSWGWTLAPQLTLPWFDAGRNQANLEAVQASRAIAVAQYEKAIQTAFREVADGLAARATLAEQLRAQQAQAEAEAARLKLSELRYSNGVSSYLDLLDAQRALFTARQAVVQTRLAQLQNQVTLYKALGGGWTAPPAAAFPVAGRPG